MQLTRVISTQLDSLNRRLIKVLRFGKSDVQTPFQALPHGIDSNPVKDATCPVEENKVEESKEHKHK
jgi:hypothetical protein